MQRTIRYCLPDAAPSDFPYTIKGFLRSKGYSTQNLKILKQLPDGILMDGDPVHLNARFLPGNTLTVNIREDASSEKILPVKLPLSIVYEDEDLLVVNKPAGMPIHPSQNNYENTLANALAYYFLQKGEAFVFRCIGRLDRDTSGLTVIAKHCVSAGILGDLVADKALRTNQTSLNELASPVHAQVFTREYLAIARGPITPTEGTISAPLGRKPGSIIERCVDFENGEHAVTHYQVLEEKNGYVLLSLVLETGRTHQIRIHLKHLGHPLIGDYLYNPDYEVIHRQALHSHRLCFPHPMTGKPMEFTAPLPNDMARILE